MPHAIIYLMILNAVTEGAKRSCTLSRLTSCTKRCKYASPSRVIIQSSCMEVPGMHASCVHFAVSICYSLDCLDHDLETDIYPFSSETLNLVC